jgi:hypothetical protein
MAGWAARCGCSTFTAKRCAVGGVLGEVHRAQGARAQAALEDERPVPLAFQRHVRRGGGSLPGRTGSPGRVVHRAVLAFHRSYPLCRPGSGAGDAGAATFVHGTFVHDWTGQPPESATSGRRRVGHTRNSFSLRPRRFSHVPGCPLLQRVTGSPPCSSVLRPPARAVAPAGPTHRRHAAGPCQRCGSLKELPLSERDSRPFRLAATGTSRRS